MPDTNVQKFAGEAIGISDIYIAPITKDDATGYTAGTPVVLAPTATLARDTTTSTKARYYSNKPLYVDTAEGETKLTLVVPGLTVKTRAELLGKAYDAQKGIMLDSGEAAAPYFALGYKTTRPDGVEEFAWFAKGRFNIPKLESQTKTDAINEKTLSVEYTAITTIHAFTVNGGTKGIKVIEGDTTDTKFTLKDTWFARVQVPTA